MLTKIVGKANDAEKQLREAMQSPNTSADQLKVAQQVCYNP